MIDPSLRDVSDPLEDPELQKASLMFSLQID
jgi:hypothetical protein